MVFPSKYDPAYCAKVIEMGGQGMSQVEMAVALGVSRQTLLVVWPAAHPEFAQALELACEASQAWWERTGRLGMLGRNIDAQIWTKSMNARFHRDWRERNAVELSGPDGEPVKSETKLDLTGATDEQLAALAAFYKG